MYVTIFVFGLSNHDIGIPSSWVVHAGCHFDFVAGIHPSRT